MFLISCECGETKIEIKNWGLDSHVMTETGYQAENKNIVL